MGSWAIQHVALFMYCIYILYSATYDKYYIGSTENLDARFKRHNDEMVPATKFFAPWELVYTESFLTQALADQREKEIKHKKSRKYMEGLVAGGNKK